MIKDAVVVFIDLVDSTQLGNTLPARQYQKFLDNFREVCCDVVEDFRKSNWREKEFRQANFRAQGDEFLAVFTHGAAHERAIDAIGIAHNIKLAWLLSAYNWDRIGEGKRPIELAAGIHRGPIEVAKRRQPNTRRIEISIEGFSISIAKRVETHSRHGMHSKILITEPVYRELEGRPQIASFVYSGLAEFKGITQKYATWELVEHSDYFEAIELGRSPAGRSGHALDRIRAVARAEPENVWLNSIELAAEFGAKDWFTVIYKADELINRKRELQQAREWKIKALMEIENWNEALGEIDQLKDFSPTPHHFDSAMCLISIGEYIKAEREVSALQRLIRRGEYSVPRYLKSAILAKTGKEQQAIEKLLAGLKNVDKEDRASLVLYLRLDPLRIMPSLKSAVGYENLRAKLAFKPHKRKVSP